jgi:23S rRNA pseudouridine2605 synthase
MLNQNEERLQKALARAGIASRRASEQLIAAGRVKVNGKIVTELGTKIDPTRDRVTVDDAPVAVRPGAAPAKIYLMLNKPAGYLSTVSDPQGRPTIMDLVEVEGRLYPVGRLDADTEGLLLLTNDGAFAHTLSHPSFGVEKEYVALLDGIVAMKDLVALRQGVPIRVEDPETGEHAPYTARAVKAELIRHEGSNTLVRFILKEGKKRQIRLMAEAVEHPVIELKRVRFGPLKLGDLTAGQSRPLSKVEVQALLDSARAPKETRPVAPKPGPARSPAAAPVPTGRNRRHFPAPPQNGKPFAKREGDFRNAPGSKPKLKRPPK